MAIQLSCHWIQKAHSITPAILMKLSPADKPSLDKSITIQTAKSCLVLENTILSASGQQLATPILFFIFPFFQTLAVGLCCVVLFLHVWVWMRCRWGFFVLHPLPSAAEEMRISTLLRLEKLSMRPRRRICILLLIKPIYMQEYGKQWLERCNMRLNLCRNMKVSSFFDTLL